MTDHVLWFENLGMDDVGRVGGKNASLGDPDSFAATIGPIAEAETARDNSPSVRTRSS
jgi:hypothetical protein